MLETKAKAKPRLKSPEDRIKKYMCVGNGEKPGFKEARRR